MSSDTIMDPHKEGHLKPRLGMVTMIGMTFGILNTWIALAGSLGIVLPSGGSVAFLYGFIFCVLCNLALGASLGELAAIWPTAGGQYHFIYALCTEKWKKFISFWTGWTAIVGWLTLVTTEGFFAAQFFSAAGVIGSSGGYEITQWKTYLIFVAILTFGTLVNIFGNRLLGRWNNGALYWSITAVIVISITILATSNKRDAHFVFADFANETGWSNGLAWILGLLQSALSLIGYDAVLHMTEEMPRPSEDAPRAIMYSIIVGGVTGVVFILVMLFCLTDADAVLSTSTNMPITQLMYQATNNRGAAVFMTVMLGVCFINGTMGCVTSASRLLYAMARDRGMIFPSYFGRIRKGLDVPLEAIIFCYAFNLCFGLLYLGPSVAFNAYVSSCTIFLNVSVALPVLVLVIRGRKILAKFQTPRTPFQLGSVLGTVCNWVSVLFVGITSVFFCFPPGLPVDSSHMNYVTVVIGIFLLVLSIYWILYGKQFEGPKFDIIMGIAAEEREVNQLVTVDASQEKGAEKL